MVKHNVKGYLKMFLRNFNEHIEAGDSIRAGKEIIDLTKNNNGLRVLNWMVPAFCLPKMEGKWPEIDGDITEEIGEYEEMLDRYQTIIKHLTLEAYTIACVNARH